MVSDNHMKTPLASGLDVDQPNSILLRLVFTGQHMVKGPRVPKRTRRGHPAKVRPIRRPVDELMEWSKAALPALQAFVGRTGNSHGVMPGSGTQTALENIVRNGSRGDQMLEADLKSAFNAVTYEQLKKTLVRQGVPNQLARFIAAATTETDAAGLRTMVQGHPLSPLMLDLVLRDMDTTLRNLAANHGGEYARYVDDLRIRVPVRKASYTRGILGRLSRAIKLAGHAEATGKTAVIQLTTGTGAHALGQRIKPYGNVLAVFPTRRHRQRARLAAAESRRIVKRLDALAKVAPPGSASWHRLMQSPFVQGDLARLGRLREKFQGIRSHMLAGGCTSPSGMRRWRSQAANPVRQSGFVVLDTIWLRSDVPTSRGADATARTQSPPWFASPPA